MTTNPSLQKKSAARMAAVQIIYRHRLNKEPLSPAAAVSRLKEQLKDNKNEQKLQVGVALEPNYTLLETLLVGVTENAEEITHRVDSALTSGWTTERTGALLIAILHCAVFELFFGKEVKHGIIIDEYAHITRSFFTEAEVDFVFGALSGLVQRYA